MHSLPDRPDIPAAPPAGPARVAWWRGIRREVVRDAFRVYQELLEAGWSHDAAEEVVRNGLTALVQALEEEVSEALLVGRCAA